jgi:ankyrin repeat protein
MTWRTLHARLYGQTPLHGAAGKGHAAVVKALLGAGATVNVLDDHGRAVLVDPGLA